MKTIKKNTEKRVYLQPQIFCIELDNEISLALTSAPPAGPDETGLMKQNNVMNPFKDSLA
jgi:hypothetical protein